MSELTQVPVARRVGPRVGPAELTTAHELRLDVPVCVPVASTSVVPPRTDRLAIASAVFGLAGFIPVASQLVGIGLGIASLRRLRRARSRGFAVRGRGWAWTGIVSSGFALAGWMAAAGALMAVSASLSGSSSTLHNLMRQTAP